MTPQELYAKVEAVVKEGAEYTQALVFDHLGIRNGEIALLAGVETVVPLSQNMPNDSVDYEVWRQVYAADGEKTDVEIISKAAGSFRVKAPIDCTLRYLTTYPNLDIQP